MNLLQAIRTHRQRWVSQAVCMLAVGWLGVVMQPCLMAADMGDHCPACPTPMTDGCAGGGVSEGCTYIDPVDYGERVPYSKLETPDENPVVLPALATEFPVLKNPCATGPPSGAEPNLHPPPLNVLFCVYLN